LILDHRGTGEAVTAGDAGRAPPPPSLAGPFGDNDARYFSKLKEESLFQQAAVVGTSSEFAQNFFL